MHLTLLSLSLFLVLVASHRPQNDNRPCIYGQCFYHGGRRGAPNAAQKAIRILQGNWLGARVDTKIAQLLIREKLGYPVSIVPVQPNGQADVFQTLVNGTAHVMMECWPYEHEQQIIDFPSVEHDSLLGVVGTSGWYIPTWLATQVPALATYQGLQNATLVDQWLSTPETTPKGAVLHGGTSANPWITDINDVIIPGLNLTGTIQSVYSADDSEDTHVNAIAAAMNEATTGIPRLFFFYAPHAAFAQYELTKVNLGALDYTPQDTFKAMYGGLENYNELAYELLRAIQISNSIQNEIMGAVTYDEETETEAVCHWLKHNKEIWEDWIPEEAESPHRRC